MVVDKRHDFNFYKYKEIRDRDFSTILVSPDDKVFYIFVNPDAISDIKCKDCLKKCGYTIDTENGEIIHTELGAKFGWSVCPTAQGILNNSHFTSNNVPVVYGQRFTSAEKMAEDMKAASPGDLLKLLESYGISSDLDTRKSFLINNVEKKYSKTGGYGELFNPNVKYSYIFRKGNFNISLYWASAGKEPRSQEMRRPTALQNETIYSSSMLQIASGWQQDKSKNYFNGDAMVNELTGMAMSGSGDLYVADKNGGFGKIKATDYKLDDPSFTAQLRKAMDRNIFATYNFIAEKKYASAHGQIVLFNNINDKVVPIFPSMKLSPDEKLLVYTVNDNLYILDPADVKKMKHYRLSCEPYDFYFTKENDDYVINFQALNEFRFPITKKYSLGKLSTMEIKNPEKINERISTKTVNSEKFSLADEIKKLKELLDAGTITKEEFDAAKKQ